VKRSASIPTIFALRRARKYLDKKGADGVSLLITGGLRVSSDFVKALALEANGVAIRTAALVAAACQQYRICHTGKCPVAVSRFFSRQNWQSDQTGTGVPQGRIGSFGKLSNQINTKKENLS
jgi:glutamate synthase domain-containing protein 2